MAERHNDASAALPTRHGPLSIQVSASDASAYGRCAFESPVSAQKAQSILTGPDLLTHKVMPYSSLVLLWLTRSASQHTLTRLSRGSELT